MLYGVTYLTSSNCLEACQGLPQVQSYMPKSMRGVAPADRIGTTYRDSQASPPRNWENRLSWPTTDVRASRADDETHEVECEYEAKGVLTWDRDSRVLGGGELDLCLSAFSVACAFGNGQARRIKSCSPCCAWR